MTERTTMPITRQRNDADELHPGANDPSSPRFVAPELRDEYAKIPIDVETNMRRSLRSSLSMSRTVGRQVLVLDPRGDPDHEETCLVWLKNDYAGRQVEANREHAVREANIARDYTCTCCKRVKAGMLDGTGTKMRTLADGTTAKVCADCFVLLERHAFDALAKVTLDNGQTLGAATARFYAERSTR
jgi:hypothetical protein